MTDITENDLRRFWVKVQKVDDTTSCWVWLGKGRIGWGYGSIRVGADKSATTSQRAAWRIQVGPIPKGVCVLHKCDNPLCVRASHLFLGTRTENSADMVAKNRQAIGRRVTGSKLSEAIVRNIRSRYIAGEHPAKLADEYAINLRNCWFVIQRRTWRWVCLTGETIALPYVKPAQKSYPKTHRVYEK